MRHEYVFGMLEELTSINFLKVTNAINILKAIKMTIFLLKDIFFGPDFV